MSSIRPPATSTPPAAPPAAGWVRRIAHLLDRASRPRGVNLETLVRDVHAAAIADGRQVTDAIAVHLCRLRIDRDPPESGPATTPHGPASSRTGRTTATGPTAPPP